MDAIFANYSRNALATMVEPARSTFYQLSEPQRDVMLWIGYQIAREAARVSLAQRDDR